MTLPLYHFKGSPNDKLCMRAGILNVIWRRLLQISWRLDNFLKQAPTSCIIPSTNCSRPFRLQRRFSPWGDPLEMESKKTFPVFGEKIEILIPGEATGGASTM